MNDLPPRQRDPFVATRPDDDGGRSHRTQAAPTETAGSGGGYASGWKWLSLLMLLGLIAVGGFAWQQSVSQADLRARFDELAGRINSTDESVTQSGAALSVKLKEQADEIDRHRGEIKKLWALVNESQRKAIADTKTGLDSLKVRLDTLDRAVKDAGQSTAAMKATLDSGLKKIESTSTAALAASAASDDMAVRMKTVADRLAAVDRAQKESQASLSVRVRENEQAIRSIDTFRREMNQQLQELRQRLPPPPAAP